MVFRRSVFVGLVVLTVTPLALVMVDMIRANGTTFLECVILALTLFLLLPIAISFWLAIVGFAVQWSRRDPSGLDLAPGDSPHGPFDFKTAIVVPIYNEDPRRVVAALAASFASLGRTGRLDAFDFFVLSDTTDPQSWLEEELAITRFRERLRDPGRIRYRNRISNDAKKAGNIGDFCRTHGERYRYMIVFDADSLMAGSTLVRLVELMESHGDAGIIQVPAVPVNRRTLFGRMQQFAARAYGPTWAAGLAHMQGGEGNYYGHNAILRIAPFREHCELPVLRGKAPLGGHVLSHDFVEAALMRRAGYKVYLATALDGSFEEPPPTLIDYAARDRRWCQGNLQHTRLLGIPGLHPISRLHLMLGVMSYLASPLWILLLLLATVEALRWKLTEHEYFKPGGSQFPIWEISIETQATILFASVMLLLFLPRGLALISTMRDRRERLHFGGGARLAASGIAECLFSILIAPVLALAHTQFVISILMGRTTGWTSQARGDRGTSLREATLRHAGVTVLGVAWSWILLHYSTELFLWMSPVLAGMTLSIPLSILSSRVSAGERARKLGLLLTPEEVAPPAILRRFRDELDRTACDDEGDERSALERVLTDPRTRRAHLALVPPRRGDPLEEHALQGLVLKVRLRGVDALSDEEQRALLLAPHAIAALVGGGAASEGAQPSAEPAFRS